MCVQEDPSTRCYGTPLLLPVYFAHHGLHVNRSGRGGGLGLFLLLLLPQNDGMDAGASILSVLLQLGRAAVEREKSCRFLVLIEEQCLAVVIAFIPRCCWIAGFAVEIKCFFFCFVMFSL